VGAACAGVGDPGKNWGHLVLAIDPDLFGDREAFINNVSTLVEKVKGTKRLPGVEEIFLPGERGNRTEVLMDVRVLNPRTSEILASTQTLWRNGGPFVIKGVKTLDQDIGSALSAVLMTEAVK
jgi:hypothetical protein